VEQTTDQTQQTVKTYTQEEVDTIVGKAKARTKAKVQRENDRKYGDIINTLRAGMGKETDSIEDIGTSLKEYYSEQGIEINQPKPTYSASDLKVLAQADADEIIKGGLDEVIEEADRLNELGADGMTEREKAVFLKLTDHIKNTKSRQKLDELGVSKDVYESDDFKEFSKMFNANTPIEKVHEIYAQSHPKKEVQTMGSMKHSASDNGVKDFYTPEEAKRFTVKDLDANPEIMKAIERSMLKW
jgi:hypothetical protein